MTEKSRKMRMDEIRENSSIPVRCQDCGALLRWTRTNQHRCLNAPKRPLPILVLDKKKTAENMSTIPYAVRKKSHWNDPSEERSSDKSSDDDDDEGTSQQTRLDKHRAASGVMSALDWNKIHDYQNHELQSLRGKLAELPPKPTPRRPSVRLYDRSLFNRLPRSSSLMNQKPSKSLYNPVRIGHFDDSRNGRKFSLPETPSTEDEQIPMLSRSNSVPSVRAARAAQAANSLYDKGRTEHKFLLQSMLDDLDKMMDDLSPSSADPVDKKLAQASREFSSELSATSESTLNTLKPVFEPTRTSALFADEWIDQYNEHQNVPRANTIATSSPVDLLHLPPQPPPRRPSAPILPGQRRRKMLTRRQMVQKTLQAIYELDPTQVSHPQTPTIRGSKPNSPLSSPRRNGNTATKEETKSHSFESLRESNTYKVDCDTIRPPSPVLMKENPITRCFTCRVPIDAKNEKHLEAAGRLYHEQCFRCQICNDVIRSDDPFWQDLGSDGGIIMCQDDYKWLIQGRRPSNF